MQIYLKEIRKQKRMTLRSLSILSGVSRTHINNIENGETSPTIDVLCRLSHALNVDIKILFECDPIDRRGE
jgi:transcriptional regulator with XRE-family HTH domain